VDVRGADGTVFARGMVFVTASDLRAVAGMQTRDLPDGMVHEVIHRDDLVVLSS
jgi:glutamate 5-kinase